VTTKGPALGSSLVGDLTRMRGGFAKAAQLSAIFGLSIAAWISWIARSGRDRLVRVGIP